MTTTYAYTGQLVIHDCIDKGCGMTVGVPQAFDSERRADKRTFYCPNGHGQCYAGETPAQRANRLREDALEAWRQERAARLAAQDQAAAAERSLRTTKGHLTRQRRRAANGVCPCCSRTFPNVADHIAEKHPKYVEATKPVEADPA